MTMATEKHKKPEKDPLHEAEQQAEKDMLKDPDLNEGDNDEDLDEGELAQRDNSDEEAFDELEKKRPAPKHHPDKDGKK